MPGEEPPLFQNSHTGMGIFHAAKFFFFSSLELERADSHQSMSEWDRLKHWSYPHVNEDRSFCFSSSIFIVPFLT